MFFFLLLLLLLHQVRLPVHLLPPLLVLTQPLQSMQIFNGSPRLAKLVNEVCVKGPGGAGGEVEEGAEDEIGQQREGKRHPWQ